MEPRGKSVFDSIRIKPGKHRFLLDYFDLCEKFWKKGEDKLKTWREAVKAGRKPGFVSK